MQAERAASSREPEQLGGAWLSASEFARVLLEKAHQFPPLRSVHLQEQLTAICEQETVQAGTLLAIVEESLSLHPCLYDPSLLEGLVQQAPISFALRHGSFLAANQLASCDPELLRDSATKLYFVGEAIPEQKVSKNQFVKIFIDQRWPWFAGLLLLGIPGIVLSALASLLQEPLFDKYIPEAALHAVLLVGLASMAMQLAGQLITSLSGLSTTFLNARIDLATRMATANRFLRAASHALPKRDFGSWRLSFMTAGAFLSSFETAFISIPLALITMVVNLAVIGSQTDLTAVGQLFVLMLIPAVINMIISYFSINLSLKSLSSETRLETIIYEVIRNIRDIWQTDTQANYISRFNRSREAIASNMVNAGMLGASTSVINTLATGLLYSFVYLQFYRSLTNTPGGVSVGSLLVIYFAIGTIGGALDSISGDLVNLAQVLPTYWAPNIIRDLTAFRPKPSVQNACAISAITLEDLTYTATDVDGPFNKPITLRITSPQAVAIVGPSGSGKSTLLRLLLGNLKPNSGLIRLIDADGMVINQQLSDCGTLVLAQDVRLFGSRLRDVVDPQAMHSDQELEEAAEAIQLKEVLESLPLRWKTPVNEYSRDLSLGQLQLFKISRVLLRPYSIVISDEPTCHLPEDLHLKALATINQNCSLHLSAIHRSSGFAQFESFLLIQPDGSITVQAEPPS